MKQIEIEGTATEPFVELADVFARCIGRRRTGGAQFAVYLDGRKVVDLAGGSLTRTGLVQVFSVSKAVVAVAAALAHARGEVDLDRPIAEYWPAFDSPAKAAITARHVLSHQAGIPAVDEVLPIDRLIAGALDEAVARQEPYWTPGTAHGYSAFTFGALLDGVFRHATGRGIAEYIAAELAGPVGAEVYLGIPEAQIARVVPVTAEPGVVLPSQRDAFERNLAIADGSFVGIIEDFGGFFNDPRTVRAAWPSMSVISSASALARLFGAVVTEVDGVRLLTDEQVAGLAVDQSAGYDRSLFHGSRYGSGVELPQPHLPFLGPDSFGHQGAGGSLVGADPARRLAVAYTTDVTPSVIGADNDALILFAAARAALDSAD